jgi:hypothetical protein
VWTDIDSRQCFRRGHELKEEGFRKKDVGWRRGQRTAWLAVIVSMIMNRVLSSRPPARELEWEKRGVILREGGDFELEKSWGRARGSLRADTNLRRGKFSRSPLTFVIFRVGRVRVWTVPRAVWTR